MTRTVAALLLLAMSGGIAFAQQREVESAARILLQALSDRLTPSAIAEATGADGTWATALRDASIQRAHRCLAAIPNAPPFSDAIRAAAARPQQDYLAPLRARQIEIDRQRLSIRSGGWAHVRCLEQFSPDLRTTLAHHFDTDAATAKRAYRAYAERHPTEPWPWRALIALASQNPAPDGTNEAIQASQRYLALTTTPLDRGEATAILAALYVRRDMRAEAGRHAETAKELAEQALRHDARNTEWMRLLTYANLSLSTNSWNSALPSAERDAQRAISASEQYTSFVDDIEAQCLRSSAYFNMAGVLGAQSARGAQFMTQSNTIAEDAGFYGNRTRCPTVMMLRGDRLSGQRIDLSP